MRTGGPGQYASTEGGATTPFREEDGNESRDGVIDDDWRGDCCGAFG